MASERVIMDWFVGSGDSEKHGADCVNCGRYDQNVANQSSWVYEVMSDVKKRPQRERVSTVI